MNGFLSGIVKPGQKGRLGRAKPHKYKQMTFMSGRIGFCLVVVVVVVFKSLSVEN